MWDLHLKFFNVHSSEHNLCNILTSSTSYICEICIFTELRINWNVLQLKNLPKEFHRVCTHQDAYLGRPPIHHWRMLYVLNYINPAVYLASQIEHRRGVQCEIWKENPYLWQRPWHSQPSLWQPLGVGGGRGGWWCRIRDECQPRNEQTSHQWWLPLLPFAARSRHSCPSASSWAPPRSCSAQCWIPRLSDASTRRHSSTHDASSSRLLSRIPQRSSSPSLFRIRVQKQTPCTTLANYPINQSIDQKLRGSRGNEAKRWLMIRARGNEDLSVSVSCFVVAAPLMGLPRTRHVIVFTGTCSDWLTRVMGHCGSDTWPCVNISLFKARPTWLCFKFNQPPKEWARIVSYVRSTGGAYLARQRTS